MNCDDRIHDHEQPHAQDRDVDSDSEGPPSLRSESDSDSDSLPDVDAVPGADIAPLADWDSEAPPPLLSESDVGSLSDADMASLADEDEPDGGGARGDPSAAFGGGVGTFPANPAPVPRVVVDYRDLHRGLRNRPLAGRAHFGDDSVMQLPQGDPASSQRFHALVNAALHAYQNAHLIRPSRTPWHANVHPRSTPDEP